MNLQATKTPLLIAAIATAVTITSLSPVSAQSHWASATANSENAQVIDANFKIKVRKHHGFKSHHGHKFHPHKHRSHRLHGHRHHGHKFHGPKHRSVKKNYVSPRTQFKRQVLIKKFF
ncbi:hypothetical protein [Tateyamaria sp. syn59]|uniref:hypothetical protein n=1 Tax=Tateyamaria sp. syn59 TaxID=2576942 RepID=UPI0011BEF875|nr:hypothetical protein [Tateyamaria sp. syn59]